MTIVLIIIAINVIFSWKGFQDFVFFQRHKFDIDGIIVRKQYSRLITSGFLHADYTHLIFNMFTFYMFGDALSVIMPVSSFLLIYLGSLIGGNLLALYVHRNHGDYSAIGASGAVSGIIYATIIIYPNILIYGFIPGWVFGIVYILYTIFGIKKQTGNIGHDAHLGGAVTGLLLTILVFSNNSNHPINYYIVAAMFIPTLAFLYLIIYHPEWMISGKIDWSNNPLSNLKKKPKDINQRRTYINREAELNQLLDKVNRIGLENLTDAEKRRLDQLS
ncbi:MAG: membrane associated rhomboid family serine protease [Bacteroidia bacterium]|jgi:membrane associated rhomboid family serine protease